MPVDKFVCRRCGICCLSGKVDKNDWRNFEGVVFDLSDKAAIEKREQEIQMLLDERAKYPLSKSGCYMLVFEKDLAICLVHRLLGYEKKPNTCKEYLCEKETK